jgi:hypothetical protein
MRGASKETTVDLADVILLLVGVIAGYYTLAHYKKSGHAV